MSSLDFTVSTFGNYTLHKANGQPVQEDLKPRPHLCIETSPGYVWTLTLTSKTSVDRKITVGSETTNDIMIEKPLIVEPSFVQYLSLQSYSCQHPKFNIRSEIICPNARQNVLKAFSDCLRSSQSCGKFLLCRRFPTTYNSNHYRCFETMCVVVLKEEAGVVTVLPMDTISTGRTNIIVGNVENELNREVAMSYSMPKEAFIDIRRPISYQRNAVFQATDGTQLSVFQDFIGDPMLTHSGANLLMKLFKDQVTAKSSFDPDTDFSTNNICDMTRIEELNWDEDELLPRAVEFEVKSVSTTICQDTDYTVVADDDEELNWEEDELLPILVNFEDEFEKQKALQFQKMTTIVLNGNVIIIV